jgi:hypothetical protein
VKVAALEEFQKEDSGKYLTLLKKEFDCQIKIE